MKMWLSCSGNYHWRKWDWYLEDYRKDKRFQRQYKFWRWCLQFKCLILECIVLILEGSDCALYGCYFLQYLKVLQCLHSHMQSISFYSSLKWTTTKYDRPSFISRCRKMPVKVNNLSFSNFNNKILCAILLPGTWYLVMYLQDVPHVW